jgi:hypothetical protein
MDIDKTKTIGINSNNLSFLCSINVWDCFIIYIIQALKLYIKDVISKDYISIQTYYKIDIQNFYADITESYDFEFILEQLKQNMEKYNDAFCYFKLTGLYALFKIFNIQNTQNLTYISFGNINDISETINMVEPFLIIEEEEKEIYKKANTCLMYLKNIIKDAIDEHTYISIDCFKIDINQRINNQNEYLICA